MKCPKCQAENPETQKYCGECATALTSPVEAQPLFTRTMETPLEELARGTLFADRYEIIEELGVGGMGSVYRVEDKKLKQEIALKLIKPEIAKDKKTVERFKNELTSARMIAHKNVCRMFDMGESKEAHFITMEYIKGEDLRSMIRMSGQLGTGTAIGIAMQICEGLSEAHRLGIVHRDLKSSNVMIDKSGSARIMDFGIARSLKGKGMTGSGVMIGTPEYMSPEQVEGKETDQRSDIYSLGVILYEMLTGGVPFEGDTPFTVGIKHKSEAPRDPKGLNPQIPEELSGLILKCLEKDKEKRYQSAANLRSDLERIGASMPTTERFIPKKGMSTSKEITVTFNLKKWLVPTAAVLTVLILAFVILKRPPQKETMPVPSDKPSVAIMYFKNNTGDTTLDHWRTALSDLLIADLAQSRYIRVLSGDRLFDILRQLDLVEAKSYSREELKKVSSRGGASHILSGDYTRAGENFRINTILQDASTGELVGSESVDGRGAESLISMVDELTKRIKTNLNLSEDAIAGDVDEEVGKITTSSAEAYKYYNEGRNLHHLARYRESIQAMEKALALDPEFAMAYRSIAVSYNNLLMFSEATRYQKKAFDLAGRLSDRERFLIQGEFLRQSEGTYDQAIEAYNRLFELYPDDDIGNTNLGTIYTDIEDWDRAIETYEREIREKDRTFFAYINQADAYRHKGMYDKAAEVLELYVTYFGDSARLREEIALNLFYQGKNEAALAEIRYALSLDPERIMTVVFRGIISQAMGDLEEAEKIYLQVLETDEWGYHLYVRVVLGSLNLMKGRFGDAVKEFEQGAELAGKLGDNWWECVFHSFATLGHLGFGRPEEALRQSEITLGIAQKASAELRWLRRALFIKGLAQVGMGSVDEAARTADELKAQVDAGMNEKEIRLYHHLRGMIEMEKKDYARAIDDFRQTILLSPYPGGLEPFTNDQALFTESLAEAYYAARELEQAQREYERIAGFSTGILYYGHIYAKSLYMLGRIYQELGFTEKASDSFEKFLNLRKDADPGLPEVEDARKRLASLKGN